MMLTKDDPAGNERFPGPQSQSFSFGPPAVVGMVGGLGEMGLLFSKLFRDAGYPVLVSDPRGGDVSNRELMKRADIVVFAVPLHLTAETIRELAPLARSSQLLVDLTSLKVLPVKEMLASRASVLGLHPMFGGRYSSFEGQTLVACPVRIQPSQWMPLRTMFESKGMHVKETTPDEHDRMMSIIQVLFHMTTMLTGRVMRELGVDIFETLDYTSPSYRLEITILGRIFAQNSALYSAITQMNPYTASIIRELREGLECYREWYDDKRLDAFMKDFEKSAKHLGGFCAEAYKESSDLLSYAVRLANGGKKLRKENGLSDKDEAEKPL